ncbi:hypothetical protein I7M25_10420, partial [Neisseria meningitidis]|nr:hypothetical protein [Neisseria meningitidis]
AGQVVEQVVRPTGLVDPQIIIRPVATQVDDLMSEINDRIQKGNRISDFLCRCAAARV